MARSIKCKRIINGKTYNTETANELAGWHSSYDDTPIEDGQFLFQTRFGAFFLYKYQEYGPDEDNFDIIIPLTATEAQAWLEEHYSSNIELIEQLFGSMPEAGSGESKFTLRMPDNLRDRLAARAKSNNRSLNAWIVRCLEFCEEEAALAESGSSNDIPPMGNMVGSNRLGWRTKGT